MKTDPFESAKLLLNRAREHRDEFRLRSQAFLDDNPHSTIIEFDPYSGDYVRKAQMGKPVPGYLFPIAADAFNNLRHALDQAVCASARAKNASVYLKGVCFAFGSSLSNFDKNMGRFRQKIGPEIAAAMATLKPYKGGDDFLWGLNELCNANKHRELVRLGADVKNITFNTYSVYPRGNLLPRPWVWNSEKNELILACAPLPRRTNWIMRQTLHS
jgi:hypothetical protein